MSVTVHAACGKTSDHSANSLFRLSTGRPIDPASLRGDFKQAVFLDKELWQHWGSVERVVSLAERSSRSVA